MKIELGYQVDGVWHNFFLVSLEEYDIIRAKFKRDEPQPYTMVDALIDNDEATTSFGMANGSTIELTKSDETLTGVKEPIMVVEKPVTNEDVQDALRTVVNKKGFPAAQELLKEFGAANAKAIPAEKSAAFVQRATEVANG